MRKLFKRMTNFFDKQQVAVTFAEANELDHAIEIAEEYERKHRTTLLVVGRKAGFSREIIDYALEMAERMSYDILALNAAPLSCETFQMLSQRKHACAEFKQMAEENADLFRTASIEKGIPFTHVVRFNELEKAIMSLCRKNKDVAFVVSETIEDRETNRIEEGERLRSNLFVYSLV